MNLLITLVGGEQKLIEVEELNFKTAVQRIFEGGVWLESKKWLSPFAITKVEFVAR